MKPLLLPVLLASSALCASCAPAKPRSWIALSAKTSAAKYVTGAPIALTLRVKNTHSRDAFLRFSSGQRFDVQIFKPGATTPVYTWSTTKIFAQTVGQMRLSPGQSAGFNTQIGDDQGALIPGKYLLRAHLTNSSGIEAPPVEIEVVPAAMQLQITPDKTRLRVGEPLSLALKLSNTSQSPQTIGFSSGQRFDISILNEAGQTVWNWAANKRFSRSLSSQTLAPGASTSFQATWDGQALPDSKITPGKYSVRAVLTSAAPLDATPVSIDIK